MSQTANVELTLDKIPLPDDRLETIDRFALTFKGYEYWGSLQKCAEIASDPKPQSLTATRTRLFFLQRAHRFQAGGDDLAPDDAQHMRDLVKKIRDFVENGNFE